MRIESDQWGHQRKSFHIQHYLDAFTLVSLPHHHPRPVLQHLRQVGWPNPLTPRQVGYRVLPAGEFALRMR